MMKKRICSSILLAILVVALGFGFSPAPQAMAAANASLPADDAAYVPGQLIVGFAPSVSLGSPAAQAEGMAQTLGAKVLKTSEQGVTLLDVGQGTSLRVMAVRIKRMKRVRYAEPNYIYRASNPAAIAEGMPPAAVADLPAVQAVTAAGATAAKSSFPNDPYLWQNEGFQYVGAEIVWPNTTPSKTVCVLDSGVDYTHPDLKANVIKGYNFVSDNADPMDDYGQGTHVAGIIAAVRNNGEGIAGVSNGKVVAVKVLDAKGVGMAYDVAQGIYYCADKTTASILDVSWTGPWSQTLQNAVYHTVHDKGKLLVAAAGDGNTSDPTNYYPAAFSQASLYSTFYGGVAAVAAGSVTGPSIYSCKATSSNYGNWITVVGPGMVIVSTTPWDKYFWLDTWYNVTVRYGTWGGTAEAAGFVSAAAARTWGYLPADTNTALVTRLQSTGFAIGANGPCWPTSMAGINSVNVASAMDRGAAEVDVYDAVTDLPLAGATVSVYSPPSSAVIGSGVVPSPPAYDPFLGGVLQHPAFAVALNLPTTLSTIYIAKVSAKNYTASPQNAFVEGDSGPGTANGSFMVAPGTYTFGLYAYVPPKSANFSVVGETTYWSEPYLAVWLPIANKFLVSPTYHGSDPANATVLPYGSLMAFPFARWMNTGMLYQAIIIHNRKTDSAAPYYQGTYQVGMTDGGTSGNPNHYDNQNASVLVWKDGVIKARVDKGAVNCGPPYHWWFPLQIISPASGAATYVTPTPAENACGTSSNFPY